VEASSSGVFMGVYDGHGGPEAAAFLEATLFGFLQQAMLARGGVTEQTIVQAFRVSLESTTGPRNQDPWIREISIGWADEKAEYLSVLVYGEVA
jgi:serine/threonine protein phosphatase PrpC